MYPQDNINESQSNHETPIYIDRQKLNKHTNENWAVTSTY